MIEPFALHRKERNSDVLGVREKTVSPRMATKKQGVGEASRFVSAKLPPALVGGHKFQKKTIK
jgi:hypothetical protein